MVDVREIALRTAPLAASVLLHVGVYGTLGLALTAPRAPAARNALLAELVVVEPPATTEVAPPAAGDHVTLSDVGPSSAAPAAPFDRYASAMPPPSDRGGSSIAALPPGTLTGPAIPRGGYQVTPSYPASARRAGIEGTTLLGVRVEADGRVGDVVLKRSAGHPDLDRAAENAVRRWRFEPAHRGAEAVAVWVDLPVQFHLR